MAALSLIEPQVAVSVPGCPSPVIAVAILRTAVDFCNRSKAYRYTPDTDISIVANAAIYDVDLPMRTEIAWLLAAELDGSPLAIRSVGAILQAWTTETGVTTDAVRYSATEVALRKVPDAAGSLRVTVALRPALTASEWPDEMHSLYQEVIAAGALARLFAQPNTNWFDMNMAAYSRSIYESGVTDAEYRADRCSSAATARTALSLIGGR